MFDLIFLEKLDFPLVLESAYHIFLSPERILISLQNGDLYLIYLINDARILQNIKIIKTGTSVIPSCVFFKKNYNLFL